MQHSMRRALCAPLIEQPPPGTASGRDPYLAQGGPHLEVREHAIQRRLRTSVLHASRIREHRRAAETTRDHVHSSGIRFALCTANNQCKKWTQPGAIAVLASTMTLVSWLSSCKQPRSHCWSNSCWLSCRRTSTMEYDTCQTNG